MQDARDHRSFAYGVRRERVAFVAVVSPAAGATRASLAGYLRRARLG